MKISDLLQPAAVIVPPKAQGKKQLLQELAARASQVTRLNERKIFETLSVIDLTDDALARRQATAP